MNRKSFIKTSALGVLAINTFPDLTLGIKKSFSNLKISITPWSLMRTGFGGDDPQGINVFDYPHIAKSLGFDFIDHEKTKVINIVGTQDEYLTEQRMKQEHEKMQLLFGKNYSFRTFEGRHELSRKVLTELTR